MLYSLEHATNAHSNSWFLWGVGCASFYFLIWPKLSGKIEYAMLKNAAKGELGKVQQLSKLSLFADMSSNVKNDKNKLVVLELGISSGPNIQFYPAKSLLIATDIHSMGVESVKHNCLANDIELMKYKEAKAEDLFFVKSNSVCAVVTTLVTCSFENKCRAYKEIYRVLIPGGRYYFSEHTAEFEGKIGMRLLQYSLFLPKFVLFYCHSLRDQMNDISKVFGAENVKAKKVVMPYADYTWNPIILSAAPRVIGYATKI
ncbi:thiol S-methyltransferase TMT1B-like [Convolutriloba macropyga]|uniref:thiol S-methyltransferase TMT1B-like n=1 Tax=Convolutriloba macropyga TaxID=536237 RepID=UPI003F5270E4